MISVALMLTRILHEIIRRKIDVHPRLVSQLPCRALVPPQRAKAERFDFGTI
jgi:hypothetical protein